MNEAGENITNIDSDDANDEQQHQVYCIVQGCKSRKVSRATPTASNMIEHLKIHHPKEYNDFDTESKKSEVNLPSTNKSLHYQKILESRLHNKMGIQTQMIQLLLEQEQAFRTALSWSYRFDTLCLSYSGWLSR